jgi:hypothetical protein
MSASHEPDKKELKALRSFLLRSLAQSKKLLKSAHEFSKHFGGKSKRDIGYMERILRINHAELLDKNDMLIKGVEAEIIYRQNQIDEITKKIYES